METEHDQNEYSQQSVFSRLDSFTLNSIRSNRNPLLLSHTFHLRSGDIRTLFLTVELIYLSHNGNLVAYCRLNFDTKFQIIYSEEGNIHSTPIGIRLLNEHEESIDLLNNDSSVISQWAQALLKLINQRGFRELFNPIRKLGKGSFASVYEIQRIKDKKHFAVKAFLKQSVFQAPNGKESLINQLNVMRQLRHKNVLKLQGVYESLNSIYVVIELITGGQLFNRYKKMIESKSFFSKEQVRTFMFELLSGLKHMHSLRLMHRDLKPENIMIRSEEGLSPVIVDFGLAANCDAFPYLFYRCGTPGYVAPEITALKENQRMEPECDVFSAGSIFHLLLTRRPLFEGSTYNQVYRKNKQMNITLKGQLYNHCDKDALDLLAKMLQIDPILRIKAVEALQHPYFKQNIINEDSEQQSLKQQCIKRQKTKAEKKENSKTIEGNKTKEAKNSKGKII